MELTFDVKDEPDYVEVSTDTIVSELRKILAGVHNHPAKQEVDTSSSDRLKIACPYCGDSTKSPAKKRGIVYLASESYYCWNGGCNTWRSLRDFFEDFNSDVAIRIKPFDVANMVTSAKVENVGLSILDVYNIKDKLIEKDRLMKKMGLVDAECVPETYNYILSRKVNPKDNRIAVNPRSKDIVFFNMTHSNKVLGIQIRRNKPEEGHSRFISFSYGDIYLKILKEEYNLEEAERVKRISLLYNILRVDLKKPLNICESSINAHHFENSLAVWGASSTVKIPEANYFFDDDKAGRTKAVDLLKSGYNVFMWRMFKKLNPAFKTDDDINDLFVRGLSESKPLFKFLTNKRLDISNL